MPKDTQKFLFHLHNFDEKEEDDGPPPPPTFSEDELGQAKKEAYEQGKQAGFQESQNSLEKQIAVLLEKSQGTFLELQAAEAQRERRYEEEAAHLALKMFQSIYPAWVSEKGEAEVMNAIDHVLKSSANQQSIRIEVSSELLKAVEERFKPASDALSTYTLSFHGRENLQADEMCMTWENGGAVRDTKTLSEQILQTLLEGLEELSDEPPNDLAESEQITHNEDVETESRDE